ncbi:hypothetical protein DEU56DRAFT_771970 [Suillus clintonianus]|uniref:uncharacterized protein n=1 Tax=Suillus clintonianus TaxID=1904413 RepID=UPI001B8616CA|nr:uncharacterized protein DEU56DRAFT_771970 [Suillus clintonianus]KAG2153943.1 hypothetical protein DEU56DRAFT_771970 [Suillus clintonianus]
MNFKLTTMATPLHIDEILQVIIADLAFADDKKSIARLARSCKAFTDPCLDNLWHTIHSFSPFIPLLPRSVHSAVTGERRSMSYHCETFKFHCSALTQRLKTLGRMPRPGEWESFDKYARRVRVYCPQEQNTDFTYYQEVYQRASTIRQKHLFPRLQHIVWNTVHSNSIEAWSLPSSLRNLTIFSNQRIIVDESLLHQVAHDAPELETLNIATASVGFLPSNRCRSATLRSHDPANISNRPVFASVTNLRITLDSDLTKIWQQLDFPVFPALETLHIVGPPTSAASFVTHVGDTPLRHVEARFTLENQDTILSDCQAFFAALFGKHDNSIQSLGIIIDGECCLKTEGAFNQFLEEFSRSLRLYVGRSGVETAKVTVHSQCFGMRNDRLWARSFWMCSRPLTTVVEFINHTWTQKTTFQTPFIEEAP